MAKRPVPTREVKPFCTCEGPFGCIVHEPNLDGLESLDGLPPDAVRDAIVAADLVRKRLCNADGESYLIDCETADALVGTLETLARARREHETH